MFECNLYIQSSAHLNIGTAPRMMVIVTNQIYVGQTMVIQFKRMFIQCCASNIIGSCCVDEATLREKNFKYSVKNFPQICSWTWGMYIFQPEMMPVATDLSFVGLAVTQIINVQFFCRSWPIDSAVWKKLWISVLGQLQKLILIKKKCSFDCWKPN